MKKGLFTAIIALVACFTLLVGCSSGKYGAMDMGGMNGIIMPEEFDHENSDSYTEITENPFVDASITPDAYFSIDANTASYPNLRNQIQNGAADIYPDSVRVEEMLNYFNYSYDRPTGDDVLALNASVFDNPYNPESKLMTLGLAAREVEFSDVKNNIVFLIDVSGSMSASNKLGLVQQAFMMMAENLNDTDRVSIVTYAGSDSVALSGAYGYEKAKIMAVIEDLYASGSTAGSKGIKTAYSLAEKYFIEGGNNRVILATDGDFNVGVVSNLALEQLISSKRRSGIYLSVFGVGMGNLKSDKMETLALKGNGTYSYIDSVREAKRALVEQIGGTMLTVAKDVKAGITFNPDYVSQWRLVGYENKLLTEEEYENDATDAGELGSGHTVTVVFEIKLTDKTFETGKSIAEVGIKYKPTENSGGASDISTELKLAVKTDDYHSEMTETDAFVSAVVEFALVLRNSVYKADADLAFVIERLNRLNLDSDEFKAEFRDVVIKYQQNCEMKIS